MQVRGAPAIAITAALSLAVELVNAGRGSQFGSAQQALQCILRHLEYLVTRLSSLQNLHCEVLAGWEGSRACATLIFALYRWCA